MDASRPSPRVLVLPPRGRLLVSTDLHGNLDDFTALRGRFERALADGDDVHWALLGDVVHGPDEDTARREPRLYGFADDSPALIDALASWLPSSTCTRWGWRARSSKPRRLSPHREVPRRRGRGARAAPVTWPARAAEGALR